MDEGPRLGESVDASARSPTAKAMGWQALLQPLKRVDWQYYLSLKNSCSITFQRKPLLGYGL